MQENDKNKVQTIWNVVKAIIGLIIGAICGAGLESTTSIVEHFMK